MKKSFYRQQLKILEQRTQAPRKFIQVLAGPRQVGKTTLIKQLLGKNLIHAVSYSADENSTGSGEWIDSVWEKLRIEMRSKGEAEALLIIDEIQRITDWSLTVKKNWDLDSKNDTNIKLIVSGSSRLLLQQGLSESLMGRYELIQTGHWSYSEMKQAFGFSPEQYVWFGGYPGIASEIGDERRFKNYIKDSVIEASISRDILMLTQVKKTALLRQVFDLGVAYNAQIVSYNKLLGQLQDAGNTVTLANYLALLGQAGLLAGLESYSGSLIRTKASSPKFQIYNQALISANQAELFADAMSDKFRWGRLVESAVGAHLLNITGKTPNANLYYWRKRDREVDFVVKYGRKILGIEVKSGGGELDMKNVMAFKEAHPEAEVLFVGDKGVKWQKFLEYELEDLF